MKMTDKFKSESGKLVVGNIGRELYQDIDFNMIDIVAKFDTTGQASYAAHAIKNHNPLVEALEMVCNYIENENNSWISERDAEVLFKTLKEAKS